MALMTVMKMQYVSTRWGALNAGVKKDILVMERLDYVQVYASDSYSRI